MPTSLIYQKFRQESCIELSVHVDLTISTSLLSKLKSCCSKKRLVFPLRFASAFAGEGKQRLGLAAAISKWRKKHHLTIRWFLAQSDPPREYGSFDSLVSCLSESFGAREALVDCLFAYDTKKVASLFRPIQLAGPSGIFDEIVGFTGIKKKTDGKLLYQMEVELGEEQLRHRVFLRQTVQLLPDMGIPLVERASKVSALALQPKGE